MHANMYMKLGHGQIWQTSLLLKSGGVACFLLGDVTRSQLLSRVVVYYFWIQINNLYLVAFLPRSFKSSLYGSLRFSIDLRKLNNNQGNTYTFTLPGTEDTLDHVDVIDGVNHKFQWLIISVSYINVDLKSFCYWHEEI